MKKNILIFIIIVAVILWVSVWAIAYSYLSNRIDASTTQLFIDETTSYLLENDDFISKYGLLISIETQNQFPVENKTSESTEYYMDFTCVTENGCFDIRVYHTWQETWTYRFEEINLDPK